MSIGQDKGLSQFSSSNEFSYFAKISAYREDCYYEKLIFFNTTIYRHILSSVNHISSQFSWCFPRSCSVRPLFLKTISPLNMIWAFLFSSLSNGLFDSKQMQITQSQSLNSSQKTIQILLFVIQFFSIQIFISCKYGAKISLLFYSVKTIFF